MVVGGVIPLPLTALLITIVLLVNVELTKPTSDLPAATTAPPQILAKLD